MACHYLLILVLSLVWKSLATELCGTVGISTTPPYFTSTSPEFSQPEGCGQHCAQDNACQSYAVGAGMCLHYSTTIASIYEESPLSPLMLYGRHCAPVGPETIPSRGKRRLGAKDGSCSDGSDYTKIHFRLLGPDYAPLGLTADKRQLQPFRPSLLGDSHTRAIGLVNNFRHSPAFFFQKPANAPAGVYDLVMTGSQPRFVAKTTNGELLLTNTSTGSTAQDVDGQAVVTSIFTVDCIGRIGVLHEGVHYGWYVDDNGGSTSFTAGIHSPDRTMLAFDFEAVFRDQLQPRSLEKRVFDFRCPPDQHSVYKPNVPPPSYNGCGSVRTHKYIPDLKFGDCCNAHDLCYDNCEQQSCDHCNDMFGTCMHEECNRRYHKFYAFGVREACHAVADIYLAAVKTSYFGCGYFKKYSAQRCDCAPGAPIPP